MGDSLSYLGNLLILLIRYHKTNMAENQQLFGLTLSSTSEVITTFSLFKQKKQLINFQGDYEICRGYYTVTRRYEFNKNNISFVHCGHS